MEDHLIYSLSVVKLAGNIHPSDSQINASILQGHASIVCLPTGNSKLPIFKCILWCYTFNKGRTTNIFSPPNCISTYVSDKQTNEKIHKHSLLCVYRVVRDIDVSDAYFPTKNHHI